MRLRIAMMAILCLANVCAMAQFKALPQKLKWEEVKPELAEATQERYPNSDALAVARLRYIEYASDGTYMEWTEDYFKVLTPAGVKDLSTFPSYYKEGFSATMFQVAEIIRADGTVVPINIKAQTSVTTSNRDLDANIYDETQKDLVLTIPDLQVGDTLHIVVADNFTKVRIPDCFSTVTLFEYSDPTPYAEMVIVAPKELPLRSMEVVKEIEGKLTCVQEKLEGGRTLYRWIARDVPQIHEEEGMPNVISQVMGVQVSTFGTWEEVSQWYWGLCMPHMEMTDSIRTKVKELVDKTTSDEERIREIFRFVSQQIRYMGVIAEDKAPGYEPHDVAMTFDNRYGVCRDKGVLLVAMLREAGYEAYPVLISAGTKMVDKVPLPYFNHAVVAIDMGAKEYLMMDPTDEQTRDLFPSYLSDCPFIVCRPDGDTLRMTPVVPAEKNSLTIHSEAQITANGALEWNLTMDCLGINDNMYRSAILQLTQAQLRKFVEGVCRRVLPNATLLDVTYTPENAQDISQPLQIKITVRADTFVEANEKGEALMSLPLVSSQLGMVHKYLTKVTQPTRRFDWEITTPTMVRETLSLKGMKHLGTAIVTPEDKRLTTNGADYTLTTKKLSDDAWEITREMALTKKVYTAPEYLELRRFNEQVSRAEMMKPLFKKETLSDADTEILATTTTLTIKDSHTTSVRTSTDRHILTYAGARDYAEEKIFYIEDFEKVTLNTVEVTRVNGEKQALNKEREVHTFDAGYTSDAPRYPAAKQMILTLPAVEEGSTTHVDTTVERKMRAPSYSYTFGGDEPIKSETFSVSYPLAMADQVCIVTKHLETYDIPMTITVDKDIITNAWTATNLTKIAQEDGSPAASMYLPTISVSLKSATQEALIVELSQAFDAARQKATDVQNAVAGLKKATLDETLRAVQSFMEERILTKGPHWNIYPEATVSDASITLKAGYGNRLDRLAVWAAALDALGIPTQLVLANERSEALEAAIEKHTLINRTERWSTPYLMLADGRLIGDESKYDEPGACALKPNQKLLTLTGECAYTPPEALSKNRVETLRRIIVYPNGDAVVTLEEMAYGLSAGGKRRLEAEAQPEQRKRMIAAMANNVMPGAEPFSKYTVLTKQYPVMSRFSVYVRNFAARSGETFMMPVPVREVMYGLRGQQRTNPIWAPIEKNETNVVELWLPKGAQILSAPQNYRHDLIGEGHVAFDVKHQKHPHSGIEQLTFTTQKCIMPTYMEAYMLPATQELDRRLLVPTQSTLIYTMPQE